MRALARKYRQRINPHKAEGSALNSRSAKLPQLSLIVSVQVKNYFWLTVRLHRSEYDPRSQDQKMVIEAILFLAFVILVGAIIVKIYEWRQDVLYGPYIGRRSERNRH